MFDLASLGVGYYLGVGSIAGLWYYISPAPWQDDQSRVDRTLEAVTFAVTWVFWLAFILGMHSKLAVDEWRESSDPQGGDGRV